MKKETVISEFHIYDFFASINLLSGTFNPLCRKASSHFSCLIATQRKMLASVPWD